MYRPPLWWCRPRFGSQACGGGFFAYCPISVELPPLICLAGSGRASRAGLAQGSGPLPPGVIYHPCRFGYLLFMGILYTKYI